MCQKVLGFIKIWSTLEPPMRGQQPIKDVMASLERTTTFDKASSEFRQHLPDLDIPRFTIAKEQDAHDYANAFKTNHVPPWLHNLTETWKDLLAEPFKGVTSDGTII